MNPRLRQTLTSGLAYGLGLLSGSIFSKLISLGVRPERFLSGEQGGRLVQGILLAFIIAGLGGFLGGFIGGWTLPVVGKARGRFGYAWESGITLGAGFGALIFPVLLIISLLSFYEISKIPAVVFSLVFGILGLFFGAILGGILGTWTLRRFYSRTIIGGAIGFGLGGAAIGYGLWRFLNSVTAGDLATGTMNWLLIGIFLFGAFGGAALGLVYYRAAQKLEANDWLRRLTRRGWLVRMAILGLVMFLLALIARPVLAGLSELLTPVDAQLSPVLDLQTDGTHWLDASQPAGTADHSPVVAANGKNQLLLGWVEDNNVWIRQGEWSTEDQQTTWQTPLLVEDESGFSRTDVQVALGNDDQFQIVWAAEDDVAGAHIMSVLCQTGSCSEPETLSDLILDGCSRPLGNNNQHPALALDSRGMLMVVWENESGQLPYISWKLGDSASGGATGCVTSTAAENGTSPRLAPGKSRSFSLVFGTPNEEIHLSRFLGGEWDAKSVLLGNGRLPELFIDNENVAHAAWCADEQVMYWTGDVAEPVLYSSCTGRPGIGIDEEDQVHIVWHTDRTSIQGAAAANVLLETVFSGESWRPDTVIARPDPNAQPTMTTAEDGSLHLVWNSGQKLNYAAQVQYSCEGEELPRLSQIMYDVGSQEIYIPADDPVPFCRNQYDQLLFTPNPKREFSDQESTKNGAFDVVADLILEAEYEVLYSTMWYDTAVNHDSPGAVVADAVADLYKSLQANPERYPRGITVRILLANPPELTRGDATGQLWSLLGDLRQAGIDKMVDPQIGWRLEVADFKGNMPHSHVKSVVIDGKTAVAAGFNTTYNHFDKDHPSGKGNNRFDLGIQITGPAAQATMRMFDDMWDGAKQRTCLNFSPPFSLPWQAFCYDSMAVVEHIPEVLKFYLPGGSSNAFSLYRSKVHDAADNQITETLAAAQESIDVIQVNFTLDLVCNLNILFDICPAFVAPDYMPALVQAAENGAKIRILIKPSPFEGIENNVSIDALNNYLIETGLEDQFEVRFYEGDMHPKVALIDNEMLIVGSQNFHYSAFGEGGGLTEYSLAVEDEQAVEDFQRTFKYMWDQGVTPGG